VKLNRENYEAPGGTIPEACRELGRKDVCVKLYRKGQQCYEFDGAKKNKCFKRLAGFIRANLADEDFNDRKMKARDYLVLLLYDIQEKIEKAVENGRVDEDLGGEIIDLIVEIKEAILNEEGRDVVKPLTQELRNKLQELKQTLDNE
jgi:hypothetical protein